MFSWYQALPSYTIEIPGWYYFMLVLFVILSPLIAFAPVSISYYFYNRTEAKNRIELNEMLLAKGFKHVRIDVVEVDSPS